MVLYILVSVDNMETWHHVDASFCLYKVLQKSFAFCLSDLCSTAGPVWFVHRTCMLVPIRGVASQGLSPSPLTSLLRSFHSFSPYHPLIRGTYVDGGRVVPAGRGQRQGLRRGSIERPRRVLAGKWTLPGSS
jgi:hypothetical protein